MAAAHAPGCCPQCGGGTIMGRGRTVEELTVRCKSRSCEQNGRQPMQRRASEPSRLFPGHPRYVESVADRLRRNPNVSRVSEGLVS